MRRGRAVALNAAANPNNDSSSSSSSYYLESEKTRTVRGLGGRGRGGGIIGSKMPARNMRDSSDSDDKKAPTNNYKNEILNKKPNNLDRFKRPRDTQKVSKLSSGSDEDQPQNVYPTHKAGQNQRASNNQKQGYPGNNNQRRGGHGHHNSRGNNQRRGGQFVENHDGMGADDRFDEDIYRIEQENLRAQNQSKKPVQNYDDCFGSASNSVKNQASRSASPKSRSRSRSPMNYEDVFADSYSENPNNQSQDKSHTNDIFDMDSFRQEQSMIMEKNMKMHTESVQNKKKDKSSKQKAREEKKDTFAISKPIDDATQIDQRSRITGTVTNEDKGPRFKTPLRNNASSTWVPRRIGMTAELEFKSMVISGNKKFLRKDFLNVNQGASKDSNTFNPDAVQMDHMPEQSDEMTRNLDFIANDNENQAMFNVYTNYYKNFNLFFITMMRYIDAIQNSNAQLVEDPEFEEEVLLSADMAKQKMNQEQLIIRQIFCEMEKNKFNSVSYFFKNVPPANLKHLRMREMVGHEETEKKFVEENLKNMSDKIKELELQRVMYLEENLEDKNAAGNDNYYDLKIDNMTEIERVYQETHESGYKYDYTFLKFNNERQFMEKLPIYAKKQEFIREFNNNQVIILQSSAGSGKSTQIPQYLLEATKGRVVITQPRAIAVESVANRVTAELTSCMAPDGIIGYICGPNFNIKSYTQVVYMTEHEFMNQLLRDLDNFLNCFDTFMVDEAHELRKPQLVMLAVLKNHLIDHPDKKLILTSATLESDLFNEYFEEFSTCVIEARTPTFGVEITYNLFPDLETNTSENTVAHIKEILDHITKNHINEQGKGYPNVLVFLPSIPEIKMVLQKVSEDREFEEIQGIIDFKLEEFHGGLTPQEKNEVLDPPTDLSGFVRIILATNIAETAVTIDNIKYVLDSGKEREYYESEVTSLSYMKTENISQSSAIQRKGRAGRICNGYCYRMYNEEDYQSFAKSKKPEIVRMDISEVILLSYRLNSYFKMSDLLFYEEVQDKVTMVAGILDKRSCFDIKDGGKYLSSKGMFVIYSSLTPAVACFLYECLRMKNSELGILASIILEKPQGYFRNRDTLRMYIENIMRSNNDQLSKLGDLAPLIHLINNYDTYSNETRDILKSYGIDYRDIRRIKADIYKIEYELKSQEHLIEPDYSDFSQKYPAPEDLLQIAFLKTYPKNICMAADSTKRYPYYLMVGNKELMKIHGSSVVSNMNRKPEWISCQNIVISTVTEREMARTVIPMSQKFFDSLKMVELKKAITLAKNCVTRMKEFDNVPTSLVQFYRRKNRIDLFRETFKQNKVYLETEEELEKVIYFYLTEKNDIKDADTKIKEINDKIVQHSKEMIKKRHALVKISERTKFQLDENCQIVDILSNSEYLSILVKSSSKDILQVIQLVKEIQKISDEEFNIEIRKDSDITFVHLLNKNKARDYFKELYHRLSSRNPPVKCKFVSSRF